MLGTLGTSGPAGDVSQAWLQSGGSVPPAEAGGGVPASSEHACHSRGGRCMRRGVTAQKVSFEQALAGRMGTPGVLTRNRE